MFHFTFLFFFFFWSQFRQTHTCDMLILFSLQCWGPNSRPWLCRVTFCHGASWQRRQKTYQQIGGQGEFYLLLSHFFFNYTLFLFSVHWYSACMYICVRTADLGVTDHCELPCRGIEVLWKSSQYSKPLRHLSSPCSCLVLIWKGLLAICVVVEEADCAGVKPGESSVEPVHSSRLKVPPEGEKLGCPVFLCWAMALACHLVLSLKHSQIGWIMPLS